MKKINTRERLLDSAFETFYKHGFQGANIATILSDVGINKGSMYHFFKSKKELGLAVIKERIEKKLVDKYIKILSNETSLHLLFETLKNAPNTLPFGCPLNKMSQEMIYIDNDFKKLLTEVYKEFETCIIKIFIQEKIKDPSVKARYLISTYEGALMIYHLNQNLNTYKESIQLLEQSLSA